MSNKKEDYHIYSHSSPSISTMGDFVSESSSIGVGLDIQDLLLYRDENDKLNLDKLTNLYTKEEYNDKGTGKFNQLIEQIRNNPTNKTEQTTAVNSSSISSIPIDSSKEDLSDTVQFKDKEKFLSILKDPNDLAYLYYTPSAHNAIFLKELYSREVQLFFQKFIEKVDTETFYHIYITNSRRTLEQQLINIKLGKSDSTFSYHQVGLAIDINLIDKATGKLLTTKDLPLPEDWEDTKVPSIARSMGIRWGGSSPTFVSTSKNNPNGGYDNVHFDLANYFDVDKSLVVSILKQQTQSNSASEPSSNNSLYFDLPIKIGTVLALPLSKIDRQVLSTETNQVISSVDFQCFFAKQLVDLLSDKGYERSFKTNAQEFKGDIREIFPYISVWVWSRSLSISSISDNDIGYEHRILNITPYVISLNTNVTESGGNFSINLAPITADIYNKSKSDSSYLGKGWKVSDGNQKASSFNNGDYVSHNFSHYVENGELKRSRMYFDKVLQANDVVFIKFEKLKLEDKRQNLDELETILVQDLPNQIFDMIGLVDNISLDSQHSSSNISITVAGRDLAKLLIEDGVYFYPTEFTADGIFANSGATNTRLKRFGSNSKYLSRFMLPNQTVDKSLKFIINNLGTIEICPTSLFSAYQYAKANITQGFTSNNQIDKRSRAYQLTSLQREEELKKVKNQADKTQQILKKIDNLIDKYKFIANGQDIFYSIQGFLNERITANEIVIKNENIVSWVSTENDVVYENKIPDNLLDSFTTSDRIWLDGRSKKILDFSTNTLPISKLESMYINSNKAELADSNLILFKALSKKNNNFTNNNSFIKTIVFKDFIDEMDSFLKESAIRSSFDSSFSQHIIKQEDVQILKDYYNNLTSIGGFEDTILTLNITSKYFQDLTIDEQGVFNDVYKITLNERDAQEVFQTPTNQPLAGIWQIIKLVVDDSVKDRRITDSHIGNENGSILNAFRKICQDPFCEFYTDTYGDQFYFIARKKPFDRESLLSVLEGRAIYEKIDFKDDSTSIEVDKFASLPTYVSSQSIFKQNLIIDIEEVDVIQDSLSYSTEAYSWYRLQLNNLTSGNASDVAFAYLKAVYFEEYADVYGSKPLDLSTSYIPYSPVIDKNKKLPTGYFIQQGIKDLKYMIESHAHLPFTRTGSITINGDRRIKRGCFVRLKSTGEIYYVDTVSHSYSISTGSINRNTTLQVSRGMVEEYIKGKEFSVLSNDSETESKIVKISYFDICSLPIDEKIFSDADTPYSKFSELSIAKWKVNKDVFAFFLKKLQFAKSDKEVFNSGINLFK